MMIKHLYISILVYYTMYVSHYIIDYCLYMHQVDYMVR